ncbi:MAG TPA: SAM-dependent methyltransferase [Trebonia sp.]|nr:SAM-dependent methyltransferase [Trebonia sp.]
MSGDFPVADAGDSSAPVPAVDLSVPSPNVPSPARMYDYYLGGKDNYASDRRAAEEIYSQIPDLPVIARDNRAFLQRAVKAMADAGIRQFIDVGTGLPTQGNVHEIAQQVDPTSRVVYLDNDPTVLAHARALLVSNPQGATAYIDADLRDPDAIFRHPDLRRLIDFDQPVGLLMIAVLHFITDEEDPWGLVTRYRSYLPPGSHLAIAHATSEDRPAEAVQKMTDVYKNASAPFNFRTRKQILALFDGLDLLDPGLVFCPDWRRDPSTTTAPSAGWNLAGVAALRLGQGRFSGRRAPGAETVDDP